jgi:arsenate reductase
MELIVERKRVLFICTHNSARSQMAEGFLNTLYPDRYEAYSAGTEPTMVNPYAIQVMKEVGIDISSHRSKGVKEFFGMDIDYVITVCDHAKQTCPFFPGGKEIIHKGFEDPAAFSGCKDDTLIMFRRLRDEIRSWIKKNFGKEDN